MQTKIINLFGSPGTGKSTTAAGLFYLMKSNDMSVELVTEYAKELVWAERLKMFHDQIYITAKQNHRIARLIDKVEYVITDSPVLMGRVYVPENYYPSLNSLIWEIHNSYTNLNFFLTRVKKYNPVGRNQNEEQSNELSKRIRGMLDYTGIKYHEIKASKDAPDKILEFIKNPNLA
jgi:tRNA uridine 5-carbamoylmethylation protein Kti12